MLMWPARNAPSEFNHFFNLKVTCHLFVQRVVRSSLRCSEFAAQNFHKKLLPRLGKARNEEQMLDIA